MVLEGSRAQSVIAAQQLMQMIETMEDQRKKIQDILRNGQNEWKAMLVAAGIAFRVEEPNVWLARLQVATPLTVLDASNGNNPQFFLDFSYRF